MSSTDTIAGSNVLLGTPNYASPEQLRSSHSVDIRADIYSLGATMYHMLTGVRPFAADTVFNTIANVLEKSVEPISSFKVDVSAQTRNLVARMMSKEPVYRPASAAELLKLLKKASNRRRMQGLSLLAEKWRIWGFHREFLKSRRRSSTASPMITRGIIIRDLLLCLAVVICIAAAWFNFGRSYSENLKKEHLSRLEKQRAEKVAALIDSRDESAISNFLRSVEVSPRSEMEIFRTLLSRKQDKPLLLALIKSDSFSGRQGADILGAACSFRNCDPEIIEELIRCGAPEEIGYLARPHVGSDKLRIAVANLRKRIISMGGEFRFGCEVRNLIVKDGVCCGVELGSGEKISTGAGVIVACGLGGRELVRNIISSGAAYTMKNYQIGCRIEHPQEFIDCKQYHTMSRPEALGAAEYHMVSRPAKSLPVSTFCMCPGGTIVNASAWENHSITNGMSNFARDGKFANSCLIATTKFLPGTTPDRAYELISRMEKELFIRGGRDYAFPCQRADDFLRDNDTYSHNLESSCETGIVPGRINDMLTPQVRDGICAALTYFDRIMRG
ncbi:MAG: hypothetical protein J6Q80_01720, partial [Lentisphaeria bacterium]|nr:hypothetical protein [Lentisphaeria bacterium]